MKRGHAHAQRRVAAIAAEFKPSACCSLAYADARRAGESGDVLHCQRTLCQLIWQAHGHHLVVIQANEASLVRLVAGRLVPRGVHEACRRTCSCFGRGDLCELAATRRAPLSCHNHFRMLMSFSARSVRRMHRRALGPPIDR
jgi:hypothetical protein